jgi:uncharacterized protein YndB with AHSA1/START domain
VSDREIRFETQVSIDRSVEEVFAYVAEPTNLPSWNSAVRFVRRASSVQGAPPGSQFSMTRELPSGTAVNELEVVENTPPRRFAIRTISGPTPFLYRYSFAPENGGAVIGLSAEVELGTSSLLAPLVARAVRRGVDSNLEMLKGILEAAN